MADSIMLPILYSFRRCPYAMRARMALFYAGINCILREVDLKNKPNELLAISKKGTVPVLYFAENNLIEESLEIVRYSLQNTALDISQADIALADSIIEKNDTSFATLLRKYKYYERYPEETQESYRNHVELFLAVYEQMLEGKKYLLGEKSLLDISIFPFIRQFALVDEEWFFKSQYTNLIKWLNSFIEDDDFNNIIMAKYSPWKPEDHDIYFLNK